MVNFLVVKTELDGCQPEGKEEKQAVELELTSFFLGFPALLFLLFFLNYIIASLFLPVSATVLCLERIFKMD